MNDMKEILLIVAAHFLELSQIQKMNVGMKLGLIDMQGFCFPDKTITEIIFVNAYKKNKIRLLVEEIQRVKPRVLTSETK